MASGSSFPGGFTVSNLMIVWSLETVSALALSQSGLKQALDLSDQRRERQRGGASARGDFVGVLPLPLGEELADHPGTGARISEPVDVELRRQLFVEHRLKLPGPQIPRRIEARIDIDERV